MTMSDKLISKHDFVMSLSYSSPIVKYSYPYCVIIVICFSFFFTTQIAFSFNTREEQALKLIHSLRSTKDFIKIDTIEKELTGMGAEILEILLTVLGEELGKDRINREFTISIIRVLGEIHDPLAVSSLLRATNILDWIVRQEAVSALTSTIDYNTTNLDMLISILRGNDSFIQNRARDAIIEMELSGNITEVLIEEMDVNRATTTRVFIVGILSDIKDSKVSDFLFSLLNDSDEEVRKEAVKALHKKNAIKKIVGKDKILKILDIVKDDMIFIELWDELIEELNVPDMKDTGFLIEALKVGVNAESASLKIKVIKVINRIGVKVLGDLERALVNTRKGSPFYLELLEIRNNIRAADKTEHIKRKSE